MCYQQVTKFNHGIEESHHVDSEVTTCFPGFAPSPLFLPSYKKQVRTMAFLRRLPMTAARNLCATNRAVSGSGGGV